MKRLLTAWEVGTSKSLKTIGLVLGAAALVATGIGAVAVAGAGIAGVGSFAAIGTALSVASGAVSLAATVTAKPPPVQGSVSQLIVDPNAPQPYVMGETYFAGVLRHRAGYGGTVDGVKNPYLFDVVVYGGGGPYQSITPQIQFEAVPSWYSGYLTTDTQLGACPEADALTGSFGTPAGWGSSYKLSGQAAIAWNYKFDKRGEKFASGLPQTGALIEGAKVYDPRLDSTFPGGSGSHVLGDEATYTYSENPALHAAMYAYGRYQNGKRVLGIGLPADGIDWQVVAAWANVCDANGWTVSGVAFEPGDKGQNLIDICAAGGGEPVPGGTLGFRYHAPAVALDDLTEADIADEDMRVVAMQSYRNRINIVIPKYRSPDHNWEMVQADAIIDPDFVTEDGEERPIEWPFNFVKNVDQAAQLAAYRLFDARERHPIELTCLPRMRAYRPGDCLHLDLPQLGLDTDAIILQREIDPGTMKVKLILIGETPAKHAWALALTGDAPPTPMLGQTAQERDETAAGAADRQVAIEVLGYKSFPADYTGTIAAELFPATIRPSVTLGGQDIRTEDSVSYSIETSGVTATVNDTNGDPDKGTIEITDVATLDGWIDLTVEVGGVTYPAKRIVVQKNGALPSGFGGAGSKIASDNSFTPINSTSFTAITDDLTVTVATGESLYGTAPLAYYVSGTSPITRTATAKWQYSPAGAGTWSDFDTEIAGSVAVGGYAFEAGYGEFTHSKSGLTPADYDVRLVAKLDAGGVDVSFGGTATIEAKT
jgi:hypothetical protein